MIKILNRKQKYTKYALQCTIEIDKDNSLKSEDSSLPSTDQEDDYDNKDYCINKDSILSMEQDPSDFEVQIKKNTKKLKYKTKYKSYLEQKKKKKS